MVKATLERTAYWPGGVYGTLTFGLQSFSTIEQPWRDNVRYKSCIPDGTYMVSPWVSPRFGKCFILSGGTVVKTEADAAADQRFLCLIHPANWPDQLQGCIAVGVSHARIPSAGRVDLEAIGVTQSRFALEKLQNLAGDEDWELEIFTTKGAKMPQSEMRVTSVRERMLWPFGGKK